MPRQKKYVWDNEITPMTSIAGLNNVEPKVKVFKNGMADFERRLNYATKLLENVLEEANKHYNSETLDMIDEFLSENKST